MPQPLSKVRPGAGFQLGNVGDYPLKRHPDLALLLAESIASWGNVESFMLNLFVDLMGGPEDRAATVFLAQETQTAKSAAIVAVAEEYLPDEIKPLLRAIFAILKTNQKARDKIAHGVWGDTKELPDALLLCNARVLLGKERPDKARIYVYKEGDFKNLIGANERLAGYGLTFRFILSGHPANEDGKLFAQLCAVPEIRERLNRPASPGEPPPAKSPEPQ